MECQYYTHGLQLSSVVLPVFTRAKEASHPHGCSPAISLCDGFEDLGGNGWCPDIAGFGADNAERR